MATKNYCDYWFSHTYVSPPTFQNIIYDGTGVNAGDISVFPITDPNLLQEFFDNLNVGTVIIGQTDTQLTVLFLQSEHNITELDFSDGFEIATVTDCISREVGFLDCRYEINQAFTLGSEFAGIVVNGQLYTPPLPIVATDDAAIQTYLDSLNLGVITYSGAGSIYNITTRNSNILHYIINKLADVYTNIQFTQTGCRVAVPGCTDPLADNFNGSANVDDDSCVYDTIKKGCTDPEAANYDSTAERDNGSCLYTPLSPLQKLICCAGKKAAEIAGKLKAGIKIACCEWRWLWYINKAIEVLTGHIPAGTIEVVSKNAVAQINLAGFVPADNMSGVIKITIGSTTIILGTFNGDFLLFTLSQFIDMLIAEILAGGTGFTGTNSDPVLNVIMPTNYPLNPVGSQITISFDPTYILRSERQNVDVIGFNLGIRNTAYVNNPASAAHRYLYVANGNSLLQTDIKDYTGTIVGDVRTFQCIPGISPTVLANGNTIQVQDPLTTFLLRGTISGPGYNAGTGLLTFTVTLVAGAVGNAAWNLTSYAPCYGSVNVYEYNQGTGQLDFLQTIYPEVAPNGSIFYDTETDSIFITGGGIDVNGVGSGIVRIDCSAPFTIAATLSLPPVTSIDRVLYNSYPLSKRIYFTAGFGVILKTDKNLNYNSSSDINSGDTDTSFSPPLIFGQNYAKTHNPATGTIYYAQYFSGQLYPNYVLQLNPISSDLAVQDTPSVFFKLPDVVLNGAEAAYDLFYYHPTQRLFVMRYLGSKHLFQSYDISSNNAATIIASKQDHNTPVVTGSADGLCTSIINYQPGHNKIIVGNDTILHFFNPDTLQFEAPTLDQPNFAQEFSLTDDMENNNFYAEGGTRWLSVITFEQLVDDRTGIFEYDIVTRVREESDNCNLEAEIEKIKYTSLSQCSQCCGNDSSLLVTTKKYD